MSSILTPTGSPPESNPSLGSPPRQDSNSPASSLSPNGSAPAGKPMPTPSVHRPPPHPHGLLASIASILEITVIALFIVTFLLQPFRIPSESMIPTLRVGDFLLVDKQSYAPQGRLDKLLMPPTTVKRGDLVVFHYPVDLSLHLVKRVIGVPGDRIHLRGGRVYLNEQPIAEPYALYTLARPNNFRDSFPSLREADPNIDPAWWAELRRIDSGGEITVPPGHFFVMGDNRNNSEDSRYWGFLPRNDLEGRPLVVYFSLNHSGQPEPDSPLARLAERYRAAFRSMRILR